MFKCFEEMKRNIFNAKKHLRNVEKELFLTTVKPVNSNAYKLFFMNTQEFSQAIKMGKIST